MPAEQTQRASPEALLALAKKEGRGHLKIFLGAAPGVGKTYAMLTSARAEKVGGRDVVAGLIETHGRRETEQLLEGFDVIPRKSIVYRNQVMKDFDLDAALARRPSLLLVDEFAHTNVPGSKHPKRWQDIDELLTAGIDVWTTLNIQHLESLNEVIQQITKVRVRETVPDSVFDKADELVLVDFPPDELLKRLAEGKVYIQETAERAVQSFFKPQNLTALRELALRRAAERIDSALVDRMQAQAIEGPWAAGERILACVGSDPYSLGIVRTAKRLADLMDAPWLAVTVEKPGQPLKEAARRRVDEALKLAETLGAETKTLVGNDLIVELLRFARFENVTQIVIGRSRGGIIAQLFGRSLPNELVRRADDIAIHVVTGRAERESLLRLPRISLPRDLAFTPYAWSTLVVAIAILVGELMTMVTLFPNVSMIFLIAVLFPAVSFGIWPAIYASFLSFLAYNFFFIEPLYTLTVAQPHELFALFVFLAVAIITSTLAGRIREQARIAANRMRATRRLYEFTKKLSGLASPDAITEAAATEINASLGRPTVVLRTEDGELMLCAAWPPEDMLDTASMTAARWAFEKDEPAGSATSTLPIVPWYFVPLRTPRSRVGVLGIGQASADEALDSESRALFDALAEQTAAALERASLARETLTSRTAIETERVRNTLLASISHDFRTPLASILGSATSLLEYREKLTPDAQKDLLGQIKYEAEHLDEMIRNLLAITRIDAGVLELRRDWIDLREVVERAAGAVRRRGAQQSIMVNMPDNMPPVRADATLAEQAIGNVIGNAVTHTPTQTTVTIDCEVTDDAVVIQVTDDGPGIPAEVLPRVFDKFFRAPQSDTARSEAGESTGLGLAITKGIMEAHGGSVTAASPSDIGHGTRMILSFPRSGPEKPT
jgi:two-component system sensor histidine kinase KdpD